MNLLSFILTGACLMSAISPLTASTSTEAPSFQLLQPPARVSETRGFLAVEDTRGKKWLVGLIRDMVTAEGSRISLLMVEPDSGKTEQFFLREPNAVTWDSFCLFLSSANKLYTTIGGVFVEFDIDKKAFTYIQPRETDGNDHCFSIAEAKDGKIYFASYPDCRLDVFDPATRSVSPVTRLDQHEKYPTTLAVADDGWIYAGIGPAKGQLIAYHPESRQRRQLLKEDEILRESYPSVLIERDGSIWASSAPQAPYLKPYQKLVNGGRTGEINSGLNRDTALYPPNSLYAFRTDIPLTFSDGSSVLAFDVTERSYTYRNALGKEEPRTFDYQSAGPAISSLVAGKDGCLYGSTEHPMVLWRYCPKSGESEVLGRLKAVGGGNMTHVISWKQLLVSNTYSNGYLYAYDPALPFDEEGETPNPIRLDVTEPVISRPRAMVAHPDGRHILSAGYPGYGRAGGGLLVFDMQERKREALYEHEAFSPGQAISALAISSEGDLYFGTSIWTPGGGTNETREARVGFFSWKERTTKWLKTPVAGAQTIIALHRHGSKVLGITSESVLFVIDCNSGKVERKVALTAYGDPAGRRGDTSFLKLPSGKIWLTMQKAVLEINPETLEITAEYPSPIQLRDGGIILNGKAYFAGYNQWVSLTLPPSETSIPSL